MNEEELMRMVVRLIGDTDSYQKMFQLAADEAAKLQKVTDDLTRTEKLKDEAIARGVEVTKSVERASEAYSREMKELNSLLKNGEITQETYARATAQSKEALKSSSSAFRTVESSADRYEREVKDLQQAVKVGAITQKEYNRNLKLSKAAYREAGNAATRYGQTIRNIGSAAFLRVTAPILGLGAAATFAGVEIQTAFAGVRKTVDVTEDQLQSLKQEFEDFITQGAPFSLTELLGTAETAGQLGIDFENIVDFTKTVENLRLASNLGEEAGESLARIANITGLPQAEFSNLGSSIVALGNTTATTERDIVNMTLRLAGAGRQVGLSVPQITALSASLSSVGIEAEAGGTAFSQLFLNLTKQVATGGKELEAFAQTAGMTIEDFSDLFRRDAAGAVTTLLRGLNKLKGDKAVLALEAMGIEGIRLTDALLRSSGAVDLMTDAMATSEKAFAENTALTKEAEVRYTSFSGVVKNAKAQLSLIGAELFEVLEPALRAGIDIVKDFTGWFRDLSSSTKGWIVAAATVASAIPPLLIALGSLIIVGGNATLMFSTLSASVFTFSAVTKMATISVGWFTSALGLLTAPIAIVGGVILGLGAAFVLITGQGSTMAEKFSSSFDQLSNIATTAIDAIVASASAIGETISTSMEIPLKNLGTFFRPVLDFFVNLGGRVKELAGNFVELIDLTKLFSDLGEDESIISYFRSNMAAVTEFNRETERSIKLNKELQATLDKSASGEIKRIQSIIDPAEQISELEEYQSTVEKNLEGIANQIGSKQKEIDSQFSGFDRVIGNKNLELAEQTLKELEARRDQLRKESSKIRKLLAEGAVVPNVSQAVAQAPEVVVPPEVLDDVEKQAQAFEDRVKGIQQAIDAIGLEGVELELFELENLGMTEEQLEKLRPMLEEFQEKSKLQAETRKRKVDAERLIKQFLPPKEKFEARKKELESLLSEGLIDQSTFESALNNAQESLDKLTKDDHKISLKLEGLDAVEADSAEALAHINEFLDSGRDVKKITATTSVGGGGVAESAMNASGVPLVGGLPSNISVAGLDTSELTIPNLELGDVGSEWLVNAEAPSLESMQNASETLTQITGSSEASQIEPEDVAQSVAQSSDLDRDNGTLVRIATAIETLVDITDGRPIIELESSELTR